MPRNLIRRLRQGLGISGRVRRGYQAIDPEDIFIDGTNLPGFAGHAMEGRIEKPIGDYTFSLSRAVIIIVFVLLVGRLWVLGVNNGEVYAQISENNRLEHTLIFANRGVIYDRNGVPLAENGIREDQSVFASRVYAPLDGLSHAVGYLRYPSADSKGIYYDAEYQGRDGVELVYNDTIAGKNGLKLVEATALGEVTSESIINGPEDGEALTLSIDGYLTEAMYNSIKTISEDQGFIGGAGLMMDVVTGELIALTSYPEYDRSLLTEGKDRESINALLNHPKKPFLNRTIGGLYAPGSIVKPVLALAALHEDIITPEKNILSTGSITVPNPYNPDKPSIFKDWKKHGWTDMREAIAVSSDTYFYSIGGGYEDQKGLGITKIDKYFQDFGFTEKTNIVLPGELAGIIPTPEWKKEKFDGDIWRLGDTYITSIGQYGTQLTPMQSLRFVAAIANEGKLLRPTIVVGDSRNPVEREVSFDPEDWKVVKEGMREAVTYGTSVGLNVPYVEVAAKTGTAEIGAAKKYIHSWSTGFFPYENPRYAFVIVLEKGPSDYVAGATSAMRRLIDWMNINTPEYFQ